MFSKSLILVLLGCALALANPIQENQKLGLQPGNIVNTFSSWMQNVNHNIRDTFKQAVQPFKQAYGTLVQAGKNANQFGKEKIEELRKKFHEITDKSREKLSEIENTVLVQTIANLQKAIGFLSSRLTGLGGQIAQGANKFGQSGKDVVNQVDENLHGIAGNQLNNANQQLNQWQSFVNGQMKPGLIEAGESVNNLGQQVQGAVGGQVENVKENLNQWKNTAEGFIPSNGFSLGEGIFNKLGGQVQDAFGNTVNAAKDNINQFGQVVPKVVEIADKLGGGVHSVLNAGAYNLNEAQKQANGFFNPGKINDGRQFVNNLGERVQGAVGDGGNNVKGNMNQLANAAQGFLPTGVLGMGQGIFNKFGNQAQETINNGMNMVGNNIKNPFEQFDPSQLGAGVLEAINQISDSRQILDNMGQQLAVAVNGEVYNVQQNLAQWQNEVEEFLASANQFGQQQGQAVESSINPSQNAAGYFPQIPGTGKGTFGKLGQNVGGRIGGGVDKVTETVGGFWNNVGKFFGK